MLFMKYKYVQINDNDASLCIAECSLSSTKITQSSAMRACSYIAECSLSSTKIRKKVEFYKK